MSARIGHKLARLAPNAALINGQWVRGTGQAFDVINPTTQSVIATINGVSREQVKDAVAASRDAFESHAWSSLTVSDRSELLEELSRAIESRSEELSQIESINMGKSISSARTDLQACTDILRFYSRAARQFTWERAVNVEGGKYSYSERYVPRGTTAAIVPWNFPLLMATWKLAPALAAGCTMILKPSELSPLSALELGKLTESIGLPRGVFQVLPGLGHETGAALSASSGLDFVGFTGSVATGRAVMKAAAEHLTPVSLELGGKSPMIICEDFDTDEAAEIATSGCFGNSGQVCSATARVMVPKGRSDELLATIVQRANAYDLNDPLDEASEMGPIVSEAQYKKVLSYIQSGIDEGAKLECGGADSSKPQGYFVRPTVFSGVTSNMKIWREEIFGPVMIVREYAEENEAVSLANDTPYGLACSVLSKDSIKRKELIDRINAGVAWSNCSQVMQPEMAWCPWKQSGFGVNNSEHGMQEFLKIRNYTTPS